MFSNFHADQWNLIEPRNVATVREALETIYDCTEHDLGVIVLQKNVCERVAKRHEHPEDSVVCTPFHYASHLGWQPTAKAPVAVAAPPGGDGVADAECEHSEDECEEDEEAEKQGSFFQYPVSVVLRAVQFYMLMKSAGTLGEVVKLASAFALPADEHAIFVARHESGELRLPGKKAILKAAVKLDYLAMLYER